MCNPPSMVFTARQRGGPGPSDVGRKRCQVPIPIPIASAAMPRLAVARMDAFHHPRPGGDFEVAIRLDTYTSHVRCDMQAFGARRPQHLPGPKAMRPAPPLV